MDGKNEQKVRSCITAYQTCLHSELIWRSCGHTFVHTLRICDFAVCEIGVQVHVGFHENSTCICVAFHKLVSATEQSHK